MLHDDARFDAAVIGGGPAGSSAAISLARAGRRVVLLEKQATVAFKVGEGLPPAARPLLRELGVLEQVSAGPHLRSYGNAAVWNGPELQTTDFIHSPHGLGWHLDRPQFDAMLRAAARAAGACVREATQATAAIRSDTGGWRLTLAAGGETLAVQAQWLIDCSGRPSWLARRQSVKRRSDDQLIGVVALFQPPDHADADDRDSLTLIESVAAGWWYTALLPSRKRVVVYLTDADSASVKAARTSAGYAALLDQTQHIRARLATHGYQIAGTPRIVAANSSQLAGFVGDGWLAAGDAGAAFDPLSSQGILTALYAGLKAGRALDSHLAGDTAALAQYSDAITAVYDAYLRNRIMFYTSERRWPNSVFWQRRAAQGDEQV